MVGARHGWGGAAVLFGLAGEIVFGVLHPGGLVVTVPLLVVAGLLGLVGMGQLAWDTQPIRRLRTAASPQVSSPVGVGIPACQDPSAHLTEAAQIGELLRVLRKVMAENESSIRLLRPAKELGDKWELKEALSVRVWKANEDYLSRQRNIQSLLDALGNACRQAERLNALYLSSTTKKNPDDPRDDPLAALNVFTNAGVILAVKMLDLDSS